MLPRTSRPSLRPCPAGVSAGPPRRARIPGRAAATLALILAALLAAALPASADRPPGDPPAATPSFSEEVSVGWVLVPVIVRSRDGYVENLPREAFRLKVDGRPVAFRDFERRAEAPISLVVLQDVSGSMEALGKLAASRRAIARLIDHARPGDELALASFASESARVDVPFTDDHAALQEAVASWQAYGTTALHDAIARLPEIAGAARFPRRAALLVTDGVDNASAVTAAGARALVRQAELPVYVLGLSTGDPYRLGSDRAKLFRYADALNLLASLTGGRYYALTSSREVATTFAAIAEELRYQYVLSFPTAAKGDSRPRRIEVELPGRDHLRVLARKGYEGRPPAP